MVNMAQYTVIGGRGFIGNEIVDQLKKLKHDVWVPQRDEQTLFTKDLGIVIYCAGNGDCQNTPLMSFRQTAHFCLIFYSIRNLTAWCLCPLLVFT